MELFPPFFTANEPIKTPASPSSYQHPPGKPGHHIYWHYFTPEERRKLKAIPEDDVTSEIQLLRVLLARCFAQVPRFPHDNKKSALPIKLQINFVRTFSRVAIVIGAMVGLQKKIHNPVDELGRDILQALREMNPYEDLE